MFDFACRCRHRRGRVRKNDPLISDGDGVRALWARIAVARRDRRTRNAAGDVVLTSTEQAGCSSDLVRRLAMPPTLCFVAADQPIPQLCNGLRSAAPGW